MIRTTSMLAVVVAVAGCGTGEATPPQGIRLDGETLLQDVYRLAADSMEGRAVGSEGNRKAREYIATTFRDAGLVPVGDTFLHRFTVENRVSGANVVGLIEGSSNPNRYIVLTAHFDHLGEREGEVFNGADDNASGTAALLAFARYFATHRPANTIAFAAVDAEENGLQGARALVADPPFALDRVALTINMDMISRSASELYVAGTRHNPWLRAWVERVDPAPPVVWRFGHDGPGSGDWTNASDHAPFHQRGIPFLYFGVEDHADYHRPTDDAERIDAAFFERAANAILQVVVTLDASLDEVLRERE